MKDEIISLKVAKLAKEKGFNLKCTCWYGCDNPSGGEESNKLMLTPYSIITLGEIYSQEGTEIYLAPTQSLLQKWLREVHDITVLVDIFGADPDSESLLYQVTADNYMDYLMMDREIEPMFIDTAISSYEKALDIGLYGGLKLIKNK